MAQTAEAPPASFSVLLGGSSGTGKSSLARGIGRRYGAGWTQADDIRLALQRVTTVEQQPDLHFFLTTPDVWQRPAEELAERLVAVGRVVSDALQVVVDHHVGTGTPIVLEGDGIVPAFAAGNAGSARHPVKAVFVVEPDEGAILRNMRERGRDIDQHDAEAQRTQARMNARYGRWLRDEAERYGLPVVEPRPWDTLLERVVFALEGGGAP